MKFKRCRRRAVRSKLEADTLELAPEIIQVIAVVAEIMLEQRRRQPVDGAAVRLDARAVEMLRRENAG